jgi:hypothetical protein
MTHFTVAKGRDHIIAKAHLSDTHSKQAFVKFTRHDTETLEVSNCNEMMFSPDELEALGKFLVAQAAEIRSQLNSN